ncbi:hypothetical protein BDR03DRAFT_61575 [Suillus americanus]|nr:hypothetical protein BDR03DRAFT_61575 [Suillus americanus]
MVWCEQCSQTSIFPIFDASFLISSSPLALSWYILDFDVLVCLLRSLYLLHLTSSFDVFSVWRFSFFASFLFAVRRLLLTYGCLFFSIFSCCRLLKTDPVSVLCLRVFIVLFASPHFDLPSISSAYPVPTHAFAPDQSFRFAIVKGRPHSLVRSPLCVIMHACTLLRSPF